MDLSKFDQEKLKTDIEDPLCISFGSFSQKQLLKNMVTDFQQKYDVKMYHLSTLQPLQAFQNIDLFRNKLTSVTSTTSKQQSTSWQEGQRRLFTWYLMCYCYRANREIQQLQDQDFLQFGSVFPRKSLILLQHHCLDILKKRPVKSLWSQQEDQLLKQFAFANNKKWNQMSKYLYIRSNRKYFRTGKQCRERWQNHLDQNKLKGKWTTNEDFSLLSLVKKTGKRWAAISKKMKGIRTEHMIKNRYLSLLNRKVYGDISSPAALENVLQNIKLLIGQVKLEVEEEEISQRNQLIVKQQQDQSNPNKTEELSISAQKEYQQLENAEKSENNQLASSLCQKQANLLISNDQQNFRNSQIQQIPILCLYYPKSQKIQPIINIQSFIQTYYTLSNQNNFVQNLFQNR